MFKPLAVTFAGCALLFAAPLSAEVIESDDVSFLTRDAVVVDATPKEVWLALISPSGWWSSAHTFSADAANLRLRPQAGGCFCETIPEVDDGETFTLEGSVEHMRVINSIPERNLVMRGALGPLQSEPVNGILTITIRESEEGTRVLWQYYVAGSMRYEIPVISKAVDGVMSLQLKGLAEKLGGNILAAKAEEAALAEASEEETSEKASEETEASDVEPIEAEPTLETESEAQEDAEEDRGLSVDEAFGDLSDDG